MRRDPTVFVMGEDVAIWGGGGVFGVTKGLVEEFGPERVRDTPISEEVIAAAAVGAAATGTAPGRRDHVRRLHRRWRWSRSSTRPPRCATCSAARSRVPLVIRAQEGAGRGNAAQHSQSLEAWFATSPA